MKTKATYPILASAVILAIAVVQTHGQTTIINGNLQVKGNTDLEGDMLTFGAWSGSNNVPGISLIYSDGTSPGIQFIATRSAATWQWLTDNGSQTLMTLDQNNQLILYSGTTPTVTISPNLAGTSAFAGNLTASGSNSTLPYQSLISGSSSILTKSLGDQLYLSLSAASGYVTQAAARTEYVSNSDLVLGTGTDPWGNSGPSLALLYGTSSGWCSIAGISGTAAGAYSTALGFQSYAGGFQTNASGYRSSATGWQTNALGILSSASNVCSTAIGFGATSSGYFSSAGGPYSTASGSWSTTIGPYSIASAFQSTAGGWESTASGFGSTAIGIDSTASGLYSTAIGVFPIALGQYSTAAGPYTTAQAYGEFVIGQFNIIEGSANAWVATDDLFTIGNGASSTSTSDAFVVRKNGETDIYGTSNTSTPVIVLDPNNAVIKVNGQPVGSGLWVTSGSNAVLNSGNVGIGNTEPTYPLDVTGMSYFGSLVQIDASPPSDRRSAADGVLNGFWLPGNVWVWGCSYNGGGSNDNRGSSWSVNAYQKASDSMWHCVDNTAPAWQMYLGYGAGDDHFAVQRAIPTSGTLNYQSYLYISNQGNVGIDNPAPAYNLDVAGNINLSGTLYQNGVPFSGGGLWIASGSDVTLASGSVGIGTTNPEYPLQVNGAISLSGNYNLSYGAVAGDSPATGLTIASNVGSGKMTMGDNGEINFLGSQSFFGYADRTYPTDGTKVGGFYKVGGVQSIWTNVNSENLVSIADDGDVAISPNSYNTYTSNGKTSNIPARLYVNGNSFVSGSIGIGNATPAYNLDVAGNINLSGTLYRNGVPFSGSLWSTSGSDVILSTGSVGIGTGASAPGATLDVRGNTNVSGILTTGGVAFTATGGTIMSGTGNLTITGTDSATSFLGGAANLTTLTSATITTGSLAFSGAGGTIISGTGNVTLSGTTTVGVLITTGSASFGGGALVVSGSTAQISGVALAITGANANPNKISNGGLIVTGTAVPTGASSTIVSSGTNQLLLIPQQGDLSMGNFTAGIQPQ